MTYPIAHHATMLGDTHRLDAFKQAISESVGPSSQVVDIGTGTGILASHAAALTKGEVLGLEYFRDTVSVASALATASGFSNLKIQQGSSFETNLMHSPEVLISETIGPIGPEENIVEIFWDFCRRHQSLTKLIPSRLQVLAVPCWNPALENLFLSMSEQHQAAGHGTFQYSAVAPILESAFSSGYVQVDGQGTQILGEEVTLADYQLGLDSKSDFSVSCPLDSPEANGVHLFFRARLSESVTLTSYVSDPLTHWRHSFVRRPTGTNAVTVSYSSKTKKLDFKWRQE